MNPRRAAAAGMMMAVPMGLLFLGAFVGIEPVGMALRSVLTSDGSTPNALGQAYIAGGLVLLPAALVVAAWPVVRDVAGRERRVHAWNLAVVGVVLGLIAVTWGDLAVEVIRCDVLGVPNCD